MHDVFISYGRDDEEVARIFASTLGREGFDVWWDSSLRSGETYDEVIESAVRKAPAVVVLWSPTSVRSRWVRSEATIGDRNRALVPAMIASCERPIMFELTQTSDLTRWDGNPENLRWRGFVDDIRKVVERRKLTDPGTPQAEDATTTASTAPSLPTTPGQGEIPSLAVLPFKNRSGLEEDDVFAIGLVEDVIDALSLAAELRVISSSAIAQYRNGEIAEIEAIAGKLGAQYILEGNVRRRGRALQVTAQMINASNGIILWTEKFERPLKQLAELEEELIVEVATHLNSQVNRLEMDRALKKPDNLTAWELVTRAVANYRQVTRETLELAFRDAQKAIEIAPSYGLAHAMWADAYATVYMHTMADDQEIITHISAAIGRALALDPMNPMVLAHVAEAFNYIGQPADALVYAQRAVTRSPYFGLAHYNAGIAHALLGEKVRALEQFALEMAVAPEAHTQFATYTWRGSVYLRAGELENARCEYEQSLRANHVNSHGYLGLFLVNKMQGEDEAAKQYFKKMQHCAPELELEHLKLQLKRWFQNPPLGEKFSRWAEANWAS